MPGFYRPHSQEGYRLWNLAPDQPGVREVFFPGTVISVTETTQGNSSPQNLRSHRQLPWLGKPWWDCLAELLSGDNAAYVTGTNEPLLESHNGQAAEAPCEEVFFSAATALCSNFLPASPFFSFHSYHFYLLATLILMFSGALFLLLHTPYFCYVFCHALLDTNSPFPMPRGYPTPGSSSQMTIPPHARIPPLPPLRPPPQGGCF